MRIEDLPRNPADGARMPPSAPPVNRVVIIEDRPKPLPDFHPRWPGQVPNPHQPIDDDQMGPGYSG